MKLSYRWLRQWVDTDLDADAAAERLTLAGLEVDSVEPVAAPLEGVVVAEIETVEPHPDADRLRICRVRGDRELRTVVCGAPNARAGLKAPLATLGSVLPGGLSIREAKLRGVTSQGMLCSARELGLGEAADGLMELPADAPVGRRLDEFLDLDDRVLDIDLTPNRADCLSVRGLARELAALTSGSLSPPEIKPVPAAIEDRIDIRLDSPADCPCYVGRVIRGVDVSAPTPLWMVEALRRSGIRSLGPIVDTTNYVLLELGQPMHAFDLDRICGGIIVRRARDGEKMTLLDGRAVELDDDMLVIADAEQALALGGIMGGQDSAVGAATVDILLESAWFASEVISGRSRRLGLATESAHRFERGVDPQLQIEASERATRLILDIAGGQAGPIVACVDHQHLPSGQVVRLRLDRLNHLLGSAIDAETCRNTLKRLGMQVEQDGSDFDVRAPSARRDIGLEVDLIEEVARVYGYDRLPSRRPGGGLVIQVDSETKLPNDGLRQQLSARGFQEILTWSFVGKADLERLGMNEGAQDLANPLSSGQAVLRTSLLPGLLETARRNLHRQFHDFWLFEIGHCFKATQGRPEEQNHLGLLMTGQDHSEHFSKTARALDFFDLKGQIEHLFKFNALAGRVAFAHSTQPWLHPGRAASLRLGDQEIGWLGQLHPSLAEPLGLIEPILIAELDVGRIEHKVLPQFSSPSRFPAVRRDLSLVVAESLTAAELIDEVKAQGGALLKECIVFDHYQGQGIENGFKSLSIGLIIRDVSRTLKDEDVDQLTQRVIQGLNRRFDAKLRD